MTHYEIIKFVKDEDLKGNNNFYLIYKDGHKEHKRFFYNQGICEFNTRSRKFGRLFSIPQDVVEIKLKMDKEPIEILRNSLKKAIKYLEKSQLWEDIYRSLIYLNQQSNETLQKYIDNGLGNDLREQEGFHLSEDEFIGLYKKGIKTIRYVSWDRDFYKEAVKKAIQEKTDYNYSWRNTYDNRISVGLGKDGKMRAWYSEEYTGCLNGHYYLALDETHVMHCEDD